jgi:hypothetical protein
LTRAYRAARSAAAAGPPHQSAVAPAPAQPSPLPHLTSNHNIECGEQPLRHVSRPGERLWSAH